VAPTTVIGVQSSASNIERPECGGKQIQLNFARMLCRTPEEMFGLVIACGVVDGQNGECCGSQSSWNVFENEEKWLSSAK
jgi:hypothetical protein